MISVVLNVYKRAHLLEQQIQAVLNQSVGINPANIHVWYNRSDTTQTFPKNEKIKTYVCNWNTMFFGRFTIPLLLKTPYVAVFDDDTIPGTKWLQNCMDTINAENTCGILGGSGVVLKAKAYIPHEKIGWNAAHLDSAARVDLVGHAWFFKQEWAKYMWYEAPHSWENGEDIMFSYLAQKYGGVNTFVPPHPENNRTLWCNDWDGGWERGNDQNASWRKRSHMDTRSSVCAWCIDNGWKTVNKTA